jgi:hypothetical protein
MDARLRTWLNRHLIEDDIGRILLPYSRLDPRRQDLIIPSWDEMLTDQQPIPNYPPKLQLLDWSQHSRLQHWLQAIPNWIRESVALFDTHQLRLLHYAARYPQLLELLDQAPVLAWKLVAMPGSEAERVALLHGKRADLMSLFGVSAQQDGVKFLRRLRLRQVSPPILAQIDTCLLDSQRLAGLVQLPRVNSMALALAARFPALIGSRLHRTLAQLPCRPMQCQAMIALLDDAYRLAAGLGVSTAEAIGDCRYLTDVESLYRTWLHQSWSLLNASELLLTAEPQRLQYLADYVALSRMQYQAWWYDFEQPSRQLWAWLDGDEPVGVLVEQSDSCYRIVKMRQGANQLPSANVIAQGEIWLVGLNHQDL